MVEGLRTKEEPKFHKFFKLVQEAAREKGCMFFLDSGESHELITEELDGEDLGGWLVPLDKVEEFKKGYLAWDIPHQNDIEFYGFANWELDEDGNIVFSFIQMKNEEQWVELTKCDECDK